MSIQSKILRSGCASILLSGVCLLTAANYTKTKRANLYYGGITHAPADDLSLFDTPSNVYFADSPMSVTKSQTTDYMNTVQTHYLFNLYKDATRFNVESENLDALRSASLTQNDFCEVTYKTRPLLPFIDPVFESVAFLEKGISAKEQYALQNMESQKIVTTESK